MVKGAFTLLQQDLYGRVMVNYLGGYYTPVGLATAAKRFNLAVFQGRLYPTLRCVKRPLLRRLFSIKNRKIFPYNFLCDVRMGGTITKAALRDEIGAALFAADG